MNKRERQQYWKEVDKVGLVIFFVCIFVFIFALRSCARRPSRGEIEIIYAQAAQDYLEEKYAEEFEINENMNNTNSGSPILISHLQFPERVSYSGKSKKTGESVTVNIWRKESSYEIEKMTDTYCLKHIRTLLQNYTIDMLSEELGELKVNVAWHFSERGFSKDINLDFESTIQDFFESTNGSFSPKIIIIIPDKNLFSDSELENIVTNYICHLKEISEIFGGTSSFHIASPASAGDYSKIETEDDENLFYDDKRIKDMFYIETQREWERENEITNLAGNIFYKIN